MKLARLALLALTAFGCRTSAKPNESFLVVPLAHARARDIAEALNHAAEEGRKSPPPSDSARPIEFSATADERTNSVIVTGADVGLVEDELREAIRQLDVAKRDG